MQKLLLLWLTLFYFQYDIGACQEKSICEKIQDCGIALYVYTERLVKNNDDVLADAAGFKNIATLKYCLDNCIGNLRAKNSEGRTALETARLCSNDEAIKLILGSLKKDLKRQNQNVEYNNYSDDSGDDWAQRSPISITRRKSFIQENEKELIALLYKQQYQEPYRVLHKMLKDE